MSFIKQPTWWQRMLPWLGLAIGIILIDQLTKITIEQRFEFFTHGCLSRIRLELRRVARHSRSSVHPACLKQ